MAGPWLDHVSLIGERSAFEALGFRLTPTDGAADHGRIFLDRAYLEVTPPTTTGGGLGSRGWFLRPDDPAEAAGALRAAGIAVAGPDPYRGEDGDWLDVAAVDSPTPAMPIVTRRVDRAAGEWPPPLAEPHPNGARRLAGLRLRLAAPRPLLDFLGAIGAPRVELGTVGLSGDVRLEIETSAEDPEGVVAVLVERSDGTALELNARPQAD